jgi:predicted O-linked N-acetylglucosamine transferase (SPINDLY family)
MSTVQETLARGWKQHQAGDLQGAARVYRQVLSDDPCHAGAHYLLGAVAQTLGRLDDAVASYREALRYQPEYVEVLNNLGVALSQQGRLDEAADLLGRALRARPEHAEAHFNLGVVLAKQERLEEALAHYRQALIYKPDYAEAHNGLANALARLGRLDDAVAGYRQALRLRPAYAEAHCHLGIALVRQGKNEDAVAAYREALRLKPDYPDAHNGLGNVLAKLGRAAEAVASYRQALALRPDYAEVYSNLGAALRDDGLWDEAAASFRQALALKPHSADAHIGLGQLLSQLGELDEAAAHFEDALRIQSDNRLRIVIATLLPPVYESVADLHAWRERLTGQVRRLHQDGVRLDLTEKEAPNVFYLAYQGLNDRDVQRDLARLYVPPRMPLPAGGGGGRRINVGFVSKNLRNHTIGKLMGGIIATLRRDEFCVSLLCVGGCQDPVAQDLRAKADSHVNVPLELAAARKCITDQGCDVLLYTDIGMDALTYSLAFSRLAPVQCVTWGHPLTTGIDALDYFLSSEALEVEGAQEHYTETLVPFKTLPIYYYRPRRPARPRDRASFGLPAGAHVYACPQSLFKLHPEFDEILGGILRRDPLGVLILLQARYPHWEELLRRRFAVTLPDVLERVRFLPRLDYEDFLSLNITADVLLDPIHFGGGNTSYEALAFGTPIVTLPSRFLRGRITYALYRQMGILDCVAADAGGYVDLAVRLGRDTLYHASVRDKILAANDVLYENAAGVRELEGFLKDAVAWGKRGEGRGAREETSEVAG